MGSGVVASPYVYENRDDFGVVNVIYQLFFTVTAPYPLTSITAYNAQGSGITQVSLELLNPDGTVNAVETFPMPTSGTRATVTTLDAYGHPAGTPSCYTLTDPQGVPTSGRFYRATVSRAQINAQGFVNLSDIGTYTCS